MDLPHDFEERVDDDRREAKRQFVDEQELRTGEHRLREAEHLLLAAGQVPGRFVPSIAKDGEQLTYPCERRRDVRLVAPVQPAADAEILGDGQGGEDPPAAGYLRETEPRCDG